MYHSTVISLLAAIMISTLSGCRCGTDRYSGQFYNIDPDGWSYGDVLEFDVTPTDTITPGTLSIAVRHTNDYLYSNIYVEVAVDGRVDTFNIPLANDFGRWFGRGIGTDYQVEQVLYEDMVIKPGTEISVRHIMRVDRLPEIEQVGISFTVDK